jgi:hypothetical protein
MLDAADLGRHLRDVDVGDPGLLANLFRGSLGNDAQFRLGGGQFTRRAIFADTKTFDLCTIFPDGSLDVCIKMVYDRPTLH